MSPTPSNWNIQIATPMGEQRFALALVVDDNTVTGTATNNSGQYEIRNGNLDGAVLTFGFDVTSPFPLALAFNLTIDGDSLSGESKAGPFPPSQVTGAAAGE
jgi:hypothetical protein